jgi:hypothetical protein
MWGRGATKFGYIRTRTLELYRRRLYNKHYLLFVLWEVESERETIRTLESNLANLGVMKFSLYVK